MKTLLFFLLFLLGTANVFSQQQTQVITRQYERTISVKEGDNLEIKGEKARITVESHPHNEVVLQVKFTARHTDKVTGETELDYMRYTVQERKGTIYIDNYFAIPKKITQVNSNLQAELLIKVPSGMAINLYNYFGSTAITNLSGALGISSEYGLLNVENCSGPISIDVTFTELKIKHCRNIDIRGSNSDVRATLLTGNIDFSGENSDIDIQSAGTITGNIEVQNGDVTLSGIKLTQQSIELTSAHGEIEVPAPLSVIDGNENSRVYFQPNQSLPLFKVNSSFGKIQIIKG
ncbi:MAG: DUF4097 family beta strand repeat-containing protein [Bacteroidia bacterium]